MCFLCDAWSVGRHGWVERLHVAWKSPVVSEIVRVDPDPNLEFLLGVDKKARLDYVLAVVGLGKRSGWEVRRTGLAGS